MGQSRPDAAHLVGGDADADPCAAKKHTAIEFSPDDLPCNALGRLGVIFSFRRTSGAQFLPRALVRSIGGMVTVRGWAA